MTTSRLTVHIDDAGRHFLRLWVRADGCEALSFDSPHAYGKHEADYRAIMVSARLGCDRDNLPTHPYAEAAPRFDPDDTLHGGQS